MNGLFFGIPVTIEEAYRIFKIDIEAIKQEIVLKYNFSMYHTIQARLCDYINSYLKNQNLKIEVLPTDKGQYIIGYKIEEEVTPWGEFKNIDDFIILLLNLKKQFSREIVVCNADLTIVTLERMEGEPEVVNNPIPYLISF